VIKLLNLTSATSIRQITYVLITFNKKIKNKISTVEKELEKSKNYQFDVPENLIFSIITIEDRRFFQHSGIDIYSIIRAIIKNIFTNRLEGASTITQQTIRNITKCKKVSLQRKLSEIIIATIIDKKHSKLSIFNTYLRTYNFNNCISLFEFCRIEKYNINLISNLESAQIAARFKYPIINKKNYINYLKRVRTIERIYETNKINNCNNLN
jgi:hypothetical protein